MSAGIVGFLAVDELLPIKYQPRVKEGAQDWGWILIVAVWKFVDLRPFVIENSFESRDAISRSVASKINQVSSGVSHHVHT
jgi:hypothetical protein